MARRRYISTEISIDENVEDLVRDYGDFAGLLYTWLIPHAEDNGCINASTRKLMRMVIPGYHWKTEEDVEHALSGMHKHGLITWDREKGLIQFPKSFYKYQAYIGKNRRGKESESDKEEQDEPARDSAQCADAGADSRNAPEVAQNPALFSFSVSSSVSSLSSVSKPTCVVGDDLPEESPEHNPPAENPSQDGGARRKQSGKGAKTEYPADFEAFFAIYPRPVYKSDAYSAWNCRLGDETLDVELIMQAAKNYAGAMVSLGKPPDKIMHPKTFLNSERWRAWLKDGPEYKNAVKSWQMLQKGNSRPPHADPYAQAAQSTPTEILSKAFGGTVFVGSADVVDVEANIPGLEVANGG